MNQHEFINYTLIVFDHFWRTNIWLMPEGCATLVGASLVLFAAYLAWRGVKQQIQAEKENLNSQLFAQRGMEEARRNHETKALKAALHAELLTFSRGLIDLVSQINEEFVSNGDKECESIPFAYPHIFKALSDKIGLIGEGNSARSIITFYTNLLAMIDMADKSMQFKLVASTNMTVVRNPFLTSTKRLADRLQIMARNLANALNTLSTTKDLISPGVALDNLFDPNGKTLDTQDPVPKYTHEVLIALTKYKIPKYRPN